MKTEVEITKIERPINVVVNEVSRNIKIYIKSSSGGGGGQIPTGNYATLDYTDPVTQLLISGNAYSKTQSDDRFTTKDNTKNVVLGDNTKRNINDFFTKIDISSPNAKKLLHADGSFYEGTLTDGHTPTIGNNGNWWINGVDTGHQAKGDKGDKGDTGSTGADGHTPTIGNNGNWWINGVDTGLPSRGEKGDSGNAEIAQDSAVTIIPFPSTPKDDYSDYINNYLNEKPGGHIFLLAEGEWICKNTITPKKNQTITGSHKSVIKRAAETVGKLATAITDVTTNKITLDQVPSDWKVGDNIHICSGDTAQHTSNIKKITAINGNQITLQYAVQNRRNGNTSYAVGETVRKVFPLIANEQYPNPTPYVLNGITIDGNRANNTANYWWYFNAHICNYGRGGVIKNCRIINVPNEAIICAGTLVDNNYAENLNGSFVHYSSAPKEYLTTGTESQTGTKITNNFVYKSNAVDVFKTEHSFCVLENSWNPGNAYVYGNYFEGATGNNAKCFVVDLESPHDWDENGGGYKDNIHIFNNTFKNYSLIATFVNYTDNRREKVVARQINNNVFWDCGRNNFNLLNSDRVKFFDNIAEGTTIFQHFKEQRNNAQSIKTDDAVGLTIEDSKRSDTGLFYDAAFLAFKNNKRNKQVVLGYQGDAIYFQEGTLKLFTRDVGADYLTFHKEPALYSDNTKVMCAFAGRVTVEVYSAEEMHTTFPTARVGSIRITNTGTPYLKTGTNSWNLIAKGSGDEFTNNIIHLDSPAGRYNMTPITIEIRHNYIRSHVLGGRAKFVVNTASAPAFLAHANVKILEGTFQSNVDNIIEMECVDVVNKKVHVKIYQ